MDLIKEIIGSIEKLEEEREELENKKEKLETELLKINEKLKLNNFNKKVITNLLIKKVK